MSLEVLFAIYVVVNGLFTIGGILMLESEITALDRELEVVEKELIKLKKEVNQR